MRINPYTKEAFFNKKGASTSNYTFKREQYIEQSKSGITAIDLYYKGIDYMHEAENLRYSTEFRRIVEQISSHWKANKWPQCE
jgi:hypothetical protein